MGESVGGWVGDVSDAAEAARVPWSRISADLAELGSSVRLVERVGKAVQMSSKAVAKKNEDQKVADDRERSAKAADRTIMFAPDPA